MLFKRSTEYCIKILIYLNKVNSDNVAEQKFVNANNISLAVKLPKEFISKILQNLTYYGVVISQKGKGGGFKLAKIGKEITLNELISVFENDSFFTRCILGSFYNCNNCTCPMHNTWENLKQEIRESSIENLNISNNLFLQSD